MTNERRSEIDSVALPERDTPTDPARRQFFRAFGQQTAAGAGSVINAADALRRGGSAAAGELLGLGVRAPAATAARFGERAAESPAQLAASRDGFSSPYRYTGDSLIVLDRRVLPERRSTIVLREPSEVAAAIRAGVVGGPVLAELTAYAIALAASEARARGAVARQAAVGAAANTLREAGGSTHAVRWAADLMAAADDSEALRAAADRISSRAATNHARLGRLAAPALPDTPDGELWLLLHGDMGPLSCGLVGTGFAIVQAARAAGRDVHMWLTDGGPARDGARITAPQLAQLEVPHTILPDAAVGWLFANRRLDAVVLRGDWVCANGDTATPIGGLALAQLAAAARVPVSVCATRPAYDAAAADGGAIPAGEPPIARIAAGAPDAASSRLEPAADVVPAALVGSFLTEHGPLTAPFERSLAGAFGGDGVPAAAVAHGGEPAG